MEQNEANELHRRFLAGELSGEELENYIQQAAEGKFDENFPDFDRVAEQYPYTGKPVTPRRTKTRQIWRSVAAVAAVLLLMGGYQLWQYKKMSVPQITYKTIQVERNKKVQITLTDGTSVSLAPGTVFSYPERFSDTLRDVFVEKGKAFFEVTENASRPFRVRAGNLETTVLGTSFTVENYAQQGFEKVNLYTGKVKITNTATADELALTPGQGYEWDAQHATGQLSDFDIAANPADAESLSFAQASLKSVLYRVAYLKNISIRLDDDRLSAYRVSGSFDGMTADEILQSLAHIHPLKINMIDHETYSIMKK
ncbi:FecR family protein [Parapedobacter deserti]|uniref:FecR family protein n=1 Tax=Parapedobacter deserti TaxID=1912957 RepID=A0ABV7JJ05_9SPHI